MLNVIEEMNEHSFARVISHLIDFPSERGERKYIFTNNEFVIEKLKKQRLATADNTLNV